MRSIPSGDFPHDGDVVNSLEISSVGNRRADDDHEKLYREDEPAQPPQQPVLDRQVVDEEEHDEGGGEAEGHPVHSELFHLSENLAVVLQKEESFMKRIN